MFEDNKEETIEAIKNLQSDVCNVQALVDCTLYDSRHQPTVPLGLTDISEHFNRAWLELNRALTKLRQYNG